MPFRRLINRRSFLAGAAGLAAFRPRLGRALPGYPFTLGVASGCPRPDGVVLWTRLAPGPLSPDPALPGGLPPEPIAVRWEIADDERMQRVVQSGTTDAEQSAAHSVHVEVRGLAPDRVYFYRFTAAGEASPVGRTRTAPAPGAATDRLRFAYASCSNYELGFFSAYRHLAEEAPDLVVFVGDYIYEYAGKAPLKVRQHSDGVDATDLRTYRNRYAQYRTDRDLQAVHAAAPCLSTWDDHEVQNDYADQWAEDFADPQAFLARRAAAYRAYWEHMPLPVSAMPQGPNATIYGRYDFGSLASFFVVDGRQHRSRLACDQPPKGGAKQISDETCPERLDPRRSYLGEDQEDWLYGQFRGAPAAWNVLVQEQLMTELKERTKSGALAHWSEDWNGYPAARQRLLQQMADTRLANPVVIGGDIHSFWANDLKLDFDNVNAPAVATEFVGTSITSAGPPYDLFRSWLPENPHIHFFDSRYRGYVSVEIRKESMAVDFRMVSDVRDPAAKVSSLQRFSVESGRPGVNRA
jgi:alkaline phosphatase D